VLLATSTQFWAQIASTSYDYVNATGPFFWLMIYGLVAIVCAGGIFLALVLGGKVALGYRGRIGR